MKLFDNREVRGTALVYIILTIVATTAAFAFFGYAFGIFTFLLCAVFALIFVFNLRARYKHIAALADEIDAILHGSQIPIGDYSEGELSKLRTEIQKMTVSLREKEAGLIADKVFLANSIADISHQIRTPLTSINLILAFLEEPDSTPARRRALVKELEELTDKIEWLIDALLKMSKLDAGTVVMRRESISLSALVKKSISPLLAATEIREQTITLKVGGDFLGDSLWTAEAIENIVKNCSEHTARGGELKITADETPLFSRIIIEDNGEGIDKEDLPHIFERFYKGKNSSDKSVGIGLALSRMIICSQNGSVKAENKKEGGARFTIKFYKSAASPSGNDASNE